MKGNTYTLTVSYDCFTKLGGKPLVNHKKKGNIFEEQKLGDRLTDKDLKNMKNYEVVGLKELKSLKNKLKKTTHRSTIKRQIVTRSQRISSRQSYQHPKSELLSKEEVLCRLQKSKLTNASGQIKNKGQFDNSGFTDMSCNLNQSFVKAQSNSFAREFSVKKLKERMKVHQQEWNKSISDDKSGKFPSIFQRIQQFRQKSMLKDQHTLNESVNNIKSSVWSQILRTPLQMVDIFHKKKVIAKTFHSDGEFLARGKSKLSMENQWIIRKESQGYQFKFCQKDPPIEQQKKTVCIR